MPRGWACAFFFAPFVSAHINALFTSSVSYCAEPKAILVQQLDVKYFQANQSVSFNVTAASVEPNLTVTANILLNVYGKKPVNVTIDLCSALGNVLCPLPQYNFSGADSVPIPPSVDVSSQVPSIAYSIPDLEAYAQVTLVDVTSGEVKACLQTTLSNGWSTRQSAVSWSTFVFLLLALWVVTYNFVTDLRQITLHRFVETFRLLQFICITGLMNLNYPLVYLSYSLNFSWSIGLIPGLNSLQRSINNLRIHTGGHVDPPVSPESTVNRKLSPYNDHLVLPDKIVHDSGLTGSTNKPAIVITGTDSLKAGIPTYTNSLQISESNAFLTIFLVILIVLAVALTLAALLYLIVRFTTRKEHPWRRINYNFGFAIGFLLLLPILIFTFYQWTLHDTWLGVLLSVLLLLALAAALLPGHFWILKKTRSNVQHYEKDIVYSVQGIVDPYKPIRNWMWLANFAVMIVTSLFVAFAYKSGETQVIAILICEITLFGIAIVGWPYTKKRSNFLSIFLGCVRMLGAGLLIAFIPHLEITPIPRVVIGIVIAVLFSAAIIVLFFDFLYLLYRQLQLHRRRTKDQNGAQNPAEPALPHEQHTIEKAVPAMKDKATEQREAPRNV